MKITTEVRQRHSSVLIVIYDLDNESGVGSVVDPIGSIEVPNDEKMVELWKKGLEAINQSLNPTSPTT